MMVMDESNAFDRVLSKSWLGGAEGGLTCVYRTVCAFGASLDYGPLLDGYMGHHKRRARVILMIILGVYCL
jgi:hypothetical protein